MDFSIKDIVIKVLIAILVIGIIRSIKTVKQGTVGVTTVFGKYRRVIQPGLRFLIPFIEKIYSRISIQNRSTELEYQAITKDQANVYFKAMILWSAIDGSEENIKKVAFKFLSESDLKTALERTVEGSTRGFVAMRNQSEILSLRTEIVSEVKEQLDSTLENWGYHLIDLQLNDIKFDERITKSMAEVVASMNLKAAATYEGDALLIKRTKEAEAEGASIKITAEADKRASELRGEGVALYRERVSQGLKNAQQELIAFDSANQMILFSMWTEALQVIAERGKGNIIFFDGSAEGANKTLKELLAIGERDKLNFNLTGTDSNEESAILSQLDENTPNSTDTLEKNKVKLDKTFLEDYREKSKSKDKDEEESKKKDK